MSDYTPTFKVRKYEIKKELRPYDRLNPFLSDKANALMDITTIENLFKTEKLKTLPRKGNIKWH